MIVEAWNWIGWVHQTIYLTLASYLATRIIGGFVVGDYDVPTIPLVTPAWFAIRRAVQRPVDAATLGFRGLADLLRFGR